MKDKQAERGAWDAANAALTGIQLVGTVMGAIAEPPSPMILDVCTQDTAIVDTVEPPDWLHPLAELRQENLIDAGNEAEPLAEPIYSDHDPISGALGPEQGVF